MKALGNHVIHADQKRIQLLRHKVGQLDSIKNLQYEELERIRMENQERLKALEEQYWGKKDSHSLSQQIREKYKTYSTFQSSSKENEAD